MILGTSTRPSTSLAPHEILFGAMVIRALLDLKSPDLHEDAAQFLSSVVPSWRNRVFSAKSSRLFERHTPRQKNQRDVFAKSGR